MKVKKICLFCFSFFLSVSLFSGSNSQNNFSPPEVDIVYTWVDPSDPLWQSQRAFLVLQERRICDDANLACRFRSRDELKYSLRSVAKYAPFVRKIYIVTNGQQPHWIKPHPKICFITHTEIFRDMRNLPTFNSMAIESNLHRIPDLSEYYIYPFS